jgi:hypothetical protein
MPLPKSRQFLPKPACPALLRDTIWGSPVGMRLDGMSIGHLPSAIFCLGFPVGMFPYKETFMVLYMTDFLPSVNMCKVFARSLKIRTERRLVLMRPELLKF